MSPGASWLYVISNTVNRGPAGSRAAIAGNATGILCHGVLAAMGLSALVAYSSDVYSTLRWLGGLYLIVLAIRTIRTPSPFVRTCSDGVQLSSFLIYRGGILMNLLNPKVALLMVALLPQFVSAEDGALLPQILTLGAVHAAIASTVLTIVSWLTSRAAPLFYESPKLERTFRWISGGLLFGLGTRTALDL
jgi:threonine/homoserine/homoserine lactone efflux protein